jgi:hypothetical protein
VVVGRHGSKGDRRRFPCGNRCEIRSDFDAGRRLAP